MTSAKYSFRCAAEGTPRFFDQIYLSPVTEFATMQPLFIQAAGTVFTVS